MFTRTIVTLALCALVAAAPAARASGPSIEPGPELDYSVPAELAKLVSDAKVLTNMHRLVARHGMSLEKITVQHLSPELSRYTFQFIRRQGNFPPAFGRFSVQAGHGVTGMFTVTSVSDVDVVEPAICPM
jgi:hypothetical protein